MDNLKNRFDQFGKDPSPVVWDMIDSALDQEEEKKIGWWLYAAAGLALALGLGYYALQYSVDENPLNIVEKVFPELNENGFHDSSEFKRALNDQKELFVDKTSKNSNDSETIQQIKDEHDTDQNDLEKITGNEQVSTQDIDENVLANHDENKKNESLILNTKPKVKDNSSTSTDDEISVKKGGIASNDILEADIAHDSFGLNGNDSNLSISDSDILVMETSSDLSLMKIHSKDLIENNRNASPIVRELILPDLNSDSWAYSANFKQGFIDNKTIGISRLASATENFTLTILDYKVESNYINEKPLWIDIQAQKRMGDRSHLIFSAEYGHQKSIITVEDQIIFSNSNKNIDGGLGIGYELKKCNRLGIMLSGILRVGNEINDWKTIDFLDNQEPSVSADSSPSADIIDQAVIHKPMSKSNVMTNGEVSLPIKYQLTENIGVQISPFVRQYFSQKYPGSDNFGTPFQWGLSGGITF